MKWWCLLAAKLALLAALHLGFILWINGFFPKAVVGLHLGYSFAVFGADLFIFVIGYALWLDQKYRCRNCLSRLRMPLAKGNWSHATLFAPPTLEWICPFGHGTMLEDEGHLSSGEPDHWMENDADFWKAFEDSWRKS